MVFLGQASNYSAGRILRHLFAWGTRKDSTHLQELLAKCYRVPAAHVNLYHTGRSALCAAIRSCVPAGSTVILPGLTCIAVVRAIKAAGCTPLFVDIDPKTLQYDWKALDKIGDLCYNGGIIAQNTLGLSLEMTKLEQFAKKHHLAIIEDLAHSAGRFYPDGREIGTVGDAVALSFGKGKAIDTISGGVAIFRSGTPEPRPERKPSFADRTRDRLYPLIGGLSRTLWQVRIGRLFLALMVKLHLVERSADAKLDLNRRLTHWQAKLAIHQFAHLPKTPLREHHFVKNRAELLDKLEQKGYYLREIWYDTPVSPARYAAEADFPATDCPETMRAAASIVNLPTWYKGSELTAARKLIAESEETLS